MEDKLKQDVETLIKSIFSEKEEAIQKQKTEEVLRTSATTIDELTTALEERSEALTTSEEKVTELNTSVEGLTTELEAAKSESTTAVEKLAEVEAKVEKMYKDKAMEERMVELETAGVVRKDKDAQSEKVREMSDVDFDSYRDELVSVREAVVEEMKAAKATVTAEEEAKAAEKAKADEAKAKGEEEASTEGKKEEDKVDTPPANIDPAQAVSAAMNLEVFPSDDMVSKYDKLGKAMAEMFKTTE